MCGCVSAPMQRTVVTNNASLQSQLSSAFMKEHQITAKGSFWLILQRPIFAEKLETMRSLLADMVKRFAQESVDLFFYPQHRKRILVH